LLRSSQLTKAKLSYGEEVAELKNQVDKFSTDIVSTQVQKASAVQEAVVEATKGVEEVLTRERYRWAREKKEIEKRTTLQISSELAIREEQLRKTLVMEKAVALAEKEKETGDALREERFKIEDKVSTAILVVLTSPQCNET
jgi:hypothetical protein